MESVWSRSVLVISLLACYNLLCLAARNDALTCKTENGQIVDWYAIYKLPKISHSNNALVRAGLAYVYITSTTSRPQWTLSRRSINDSMSMPGRTLAPIYNVAASIIRQGPSLLWMMYNDQSPDEPVSYTHGHTKGVIMANQNSGIWLIHSVPHFPTPANESYGYPSTGEHYGQTFLCISLGRQQLENVATQLTYNFPKIFNSNLPEEMTSNYPNLGSVIRGTHVNTAPYFRQTTLQSMAGQQFVSFAKTTQFGKDLYADWVSQSLRASLLVESWPNGPGRLPSACQRNYKVENILALNISTNGAQIFDFRDQQDHSKWATQSETAPKDHWICIGDINRMESQEERAGGTVCFNHLAAWRVFRSSIVKREACGSRVHTNTVS